MYLNENSPTMISNKRLTAYFFIKTTEFDNIFGHLNNIFGQFDKFSDNFYQILL